MRYSCYTRRLCLSVCLVSPGRRPLSCPAAAVAGPWSVGALRPRSKGLFHQIQLAQVKLYYHDDDDDDDDVRDGGICTVIKYSYTVTAA